MPLRFLEPVLRNSSQVPLCIVLVIPFLLQIVAVMGLIGYFSLRNSRRNLDEVTALLRNEVTTRIQQHTAVYLQTPETVIQLNINAIQAGRLNLQSSRNLERYLWQQMQLFPSLSPIAIGNERGEIHSVDRLKDGSLVIRVLDRSTGGEYHTYTIDQKGNRGKLIQTSNRFDPRVRPWYTAAIKARKLTWTEIYPYFSSSGLAISATQPFYDTTTNQLLGVTNATLSLAEVSDFLRRLEISRSGQTFIMERSGKLVASSTGEQLFTIHRDGQTTTQQRLPAIASRYLLTRQTAQFLSNHFGHFNHITQSHLLDFEVDGRRQLVQVSPFRDRHGLNWLIVVVLPEAELMEHIRANTQATILLCLIALLLASIFGFLTAHWLAQPIRRLGQVSQAIANGKLQHTIEPQGIRELNDLAQSYNQMAAQLQASFIALETTNEALEFRVEQRTQQHEEAQKIAHVGNWEFDLKTQQITWSTEVFRIFGRDPKASTPTYEQFLQLLYPADREHFIELVTRAMQEGEAYELDAKIEQINGSVRDVFIKGQPILDETGRVIKLFGTILDISDRKQVEAQLRASLLDREVLLKEIHHRVKNNLQVISSLLRLQANAIQDPNILSSFKDSQNRVRAMALIHERLYQSHSLAKIYFPEYVRKLTSDVLRSYNFASSTIRIYSNITDVELKVDTVIPCGLIINELVSNAIKYAFPTQTNGEIRIAFIEQAADRYQLIVQDNGIGLPEGFDFHNTASLGLQLVCALTEQLQGTIVLNNSNGTAFTITFSDSTVI